ncbi:hypothetical protein UFOVP209_16 [uncultured Caudovirales phage]|uniref:Uncharacterized protein n=1 Tax=uncultured Caudovirales phage TaxID=2100421 RepID=A0A6J7WQY6_9CAUD|nr:hypothetical protein UFOVP209_16 [uncultured Caudovirales phage]
MLRRAQVLSTLIELAGIAAITVGTAFIFWPAALIVSGIALVAIGYSLGIETGKQQ